MKTDPRVKAIAARIEKHLGFTNGWKVGDESYTALARDAASDILAYLARRDLVLLKKARR